MTPRSRTNQLLYQAELLLNLSVGNDEHAASRRMAGEEGALALMELALNAALRELTEHARLARHDWRELLGNGGEAIAEVQRLREMREMPDSWLAVLTMRIETLHGVEGAARRESQDETLIVAADRLALADELRWCLREFKTSLSELRETSIEW
ncbi:hypothetical protein MHM84_04770 [Halomonas sp. McH1-25]|uniref:DUF6586 family protein n=1 Tax=unclassified Halomonas TaxID=2609666 RepID=UPI001EF4E74F|nr:MULTISPECIES: DUF6586 family protein [unclassified Halomonas]MCG7599088.1 hypothetical protein [Halomonas sp. McH1-25]MCP1342355.1 hypothetical protein [Halomonas sp. FL8]MCP1360391.1 hypothetical protein [Halomonas sp. BBD45]MCP1367122.1 hypothetical protein [Halomonas sp. BBD48]